MTGKQEYPFGVPIKYRKLHIISGNWGYWAVTFLKDFGPWKKGQKLDHLWFLWEQQRLEGEVREVRDGKRQYAFQGQLPFRLSFGE